MFTQQSSILINSLRNSAIQGQNEPSSSLPSWLDNTRTPMQYEDEKANSFRSQSTIPAEGFGDKNIDSRYYSASNVTDTECLKDSWRHENLDAPNQRNIDVGGRLNSDNSYYQRLDYGHCRRSPTTFDNATDQPFPKDSNSGLQRKEYLTNIPAISDDELFRLFEDGLNVMVQTSDGIQAFMDFDPELRSFFLPIFKDHDLDAVIQVFGQGEESVAVKKLEEMVLLIKNKIQHLCTEIAETISIRSEKEAEQKSRRFAKPVRSLYNREKPVDQREDDSNERSEFCQSSDDSDSDILMQQCLKLPLDDHQPAGLFPQPNFPQTLQPLNPVRMFPAPLHPLKIPLMPVPNLGSRMPSFMVTTAQGNTLLPPPVIQPLLGIPIRPFQSMPAASTTLLPKERSHLVGPAVKRPQKIRYPPYLRSVPLLSKSNTKTQSSDISISKIRSISPKKEPDPKKAKTSKIPSLFDTVTKFSKYHPEGESNFLKKMKILSARAKSCPEQNLELDAKKAKTTNLPSLSNSVTPLSKSNENTKISYNSVNMIKNINTKKSETKIRLTDLSPKEKIVYLIEQLKNSEENVPSKNIFLDKLFDKIGRQWLQINYIVKQQDDFVFGSLSIAGVFITRQKTKQKTLLRKTILERAYDVLRLISVDDIIELGDPNANDKTPLKEEKFDLIINIKKIQNFIDTWSKNNNQPNITLADINKSDMDTSLLVQVNKMKKSPKTSLQVIGKVTLGTCQIALKSASTVKTATDKAVANAIQRFKSLSPEEIAYEKGMESSTM